MAIGTTTAILGGAALGYLGSRQQAQAAESAAAGQAQSASNAQELQRQMFNIQNAQQQPYREAGYGALTNIQQMLPQLTAVPEAYRPFTAADLKTNLAPNYQFMLEQGLGATRQAMNVGGGGSNVTRAATKFAEDYAGNAYQNALANYMNQQAQGFSQQQTGIGNVYNRLASIAGIGQAAQNQAQALGQSTAANIGQLGIGGATAAGAGQIGAANAMAGGLSNIGNAATLASLLRGNTNSIGALQNQYGVGNVYGAGINNPPPGVIDFTVS
jgi:hypothetical protein